MKNAETRTDLPKFIDTLSKSRAKNLPERFDPSRLTTDVMSLVEMIDGKVVDQKGKTIALIPGSFRPPHKGHLDMIKHYAEICDEVIVAVSGQTNVASQRYDKLGRAMPNFVAGEILEIYCKAANLDNVQIAMTLNPMNWISATVRHFSNCKVMFGLSKKDDMSRFSAFTTDRFKDTLQNVEILPIEENAIDATTDGDSNISATYVRDHIDDKEALRKVLPSELSDAQFDEVYNLMNPESGDYPSMTDQARADKFNKKQFNEGGHAETTCPEELRARINQENVQATLEDIYKRLLPKLGLTKDDVECVGSTGKKLPGGTSGDIDLAMPQDKIMQTTECETPEEFIDFCQGLFEELDVYDATSKGYGWKSVSCFWPIANEDGKQEGKYVQLDFVITNNMKFVSWGMHGDQEQEVPDGANPDDINPKGAVRMILLKAIAMGGHKTITKTAEIPGEGDNEPIEMERYDFKFNEGLYKVKRERPKRKRGEGYLGWKVVNKEFITDDPDEIVHFVFNDDTLDYKDLMTVRDMYDALLDSPMWEDEETRHEIGRCFQNEMEQHKGRYGAPSWLKFN